MISGKSALLLDMNSTFMFGEDRFGDTEDFSVRYFESGARNAGIDCILVGGAAHRDALTSFGTLLDFCDAIN